MDVYADTVKTDVTSARLRREHAGAYDRAAVHPMVRAVRDGTLDAEAFDRLVVVNGFFERTYRRFLQVLGTIAPDSDASRLMFKAVRGVDLDLGSTNTYAASVGLDLDRPPSARAMDYASYVMASAGEGWARGLAVAFACETLFQGVWSQAARSTPPESARAVFAARWDPDSDLFMAGLAREIDKLPWSPELSAVVGDVLERELGSWDEVMLGWPDGR